MPALAQATTQNPTPFSKSAPNLDKTRVAGNDSPTNASSTSHNNFLGKSVDALNMIKSGKSNNNYSNTTTNKLGQSGGSGVGGDRKYNRYDRRSKSYRNIGEVYYDNDDDDDETAETIGCFSFIGRNEDTLMKRKKHSLDSKMSEDASAASNSSASTLPLHMAVKTIGAAAYVQEIDDDGSRGGGGDDDDNNNIDDGDDTRRPYSNLNNVIYDSLFYRNIQKSLDDISIGCHPNQRQAYMPFEESHFDRACFFVNPSKEDDNENDNDNDSSFDAGASTTHEMSQKSIDLSTDDNIYHDEQTTHSSTETAASMSRKNSVVTFRDDDDDSAQYSILSDTSEDSTSKTKIMGHYAIISRWTNNNSNQTTNSNNNNNNNQNSILGSNSGRISNLSNVSQKVVNVPKKEWKEKKSYMIWNKLGRKKGAKAEMDEQLLDDDSISSKHYTQV